MPHHTANNGHGYIFATFRAGLTPAESNQGLQDLKAVSPDIINEASLMERKPFDPSGGRPGDKVVIFVETNLAKSSKAAHDRIEGLAARLEAKTDAAGIPYLIAGLSNHWCCYSDQ